MRSETVVREFQRLLEPGTVSGLREGELLERFAERADPVAFEAIISRHGPMVYTVCRRILRDPNDVDDAFQATFLILIKKASKLRQPERLGPWLWGVACRVAHRARARRRTRDLPEDLASPRLACPVEDNEQVEALLDEIQRLPERYRVPIVLCCIEGLSHDEAASRLGWPVGTVHGRLSRARERLRGRLARRGVMVSETIREAFALIRPGQMILPDATRVAAAALVRGTVPAGLEILTKGVLSAMITAKLKHTGIIIFVALIGLGAVTALMGYQGPVSEREVPKARLTISQKVSVDNRTKSQTRPIPVASTKPDDEEAVSKLGGLRAKAELLEIWIAFRKRRFIAGLERLDRLNARHRNARLDEGVSQETPDKEQSRRPEEIRLRLAITEQQDMLEGDRQGYVANTIELAVLKRRIARESKALEEPIGRDRSAAEIVRRLDRLEEKVDQLVSALPTKTDP